MNSITTALVKSKCLYRLPETVRDFSDQQLPRDFFVLLLLLPARQPI